MILLRALCVWIALPAVALSFLPLPLVWIFLAWAAALIMQARRSERRPGRRGAIVAAGVLIALALGEVVAYEPPPRDLECVHDVSARPTPEDGFDGELGYGPAPSRSVRGKELSGGRPEYEVFCTTDANGQRITPPSAGPESVLFFGGSYTFGNGVEDQEPSAWLVGEALGGRARVYNFGFSGYGPHQTLAALQCGRVEEIVDAPPRFAIFQLILSHISRVAGRVDWEVHGPRYTLDERGHAVRAGRFCDAPLPVPWYLALARRSSLYRKVRSRTTPQSEVILAVAVLDEIRRDVETRFPGCEFHILFWDETREKSDRVLGELGAGDFRVHRVSEFIPGYVEDRTVAYLSKDDYHPHPAAHAFVARFLLDTILAPLASDGPG